MEKGVFSYPKSPYRPLLDKKKISFSDQRNGSAEKASKVHSRLSGKKVCIIPSTSIKAKRKCRGMA